MSVLLAALQLLSLASGAQDAPAQSAPPDEYAIDGRASCSNIDPFEERRCVAERIEAREATLDRVFASARRAVERSHASYGEWDNRTDPRYLDESQAGWKSYVDANCTAAAAFGGGSNSAISDRYFDCYEDELDRRIVFLRDMAEGTGQFGP